MLPVSYLSCRVLYKELHLYFVLTLKHRLLLCRGWVRMAHLRLNLGGKYDLSFKIIQTVGAFFTLYAMWSQALLRETSKANKTSFI